MPASARPAGSATSIPEMYHDRTHVLHDGVQSDLVCPAPVAEFMLPDGRGTLNSGDEVLTFVARNLEPYRGFHTFMRACRRCSPPDPDCRY
jgi:hypothetical protein